MAATDRPAKFAIVGTGWRSEFFLRVAAELPGRFAVTGVHSRSAARREELAHRFGTLAVGSVGEAAKQGEPDFVIVAVPWPAAPEITQQIVELGVAVLEETPPAPDLPMMRALWSRVGERDLVQVAEHNMFMPAHRARLRMVKEGLVGEPTSVQVTSNHLYHAVSIMRGLLDVGRGPTTVIANSVSTSLVDPIAFGGASSDNPDPVPRTATLAILDFGGGRTGLYDFTENQWWNPLRHRRLTVRGTGGEIVDDRVVFLEDPRTIVESTVTRRQTGIDMNLEGFFLDSIAVNGRAMYRNPYRPARLSDEDIAVATVVERMSMWVRGEGPPPYPLADGLQDHLLGLAIEESARLGRPVVTATEPWADAIGPDFEAGVPGES
ncbi:Gfo/Idh/MocA family oxidoreductase [Streptomyces sp. NBC_01239]|uniref:Gfo/Idh/MocA family protein n=1 Tax=Streptomyces sp. NBC_01239 TaxID=2903792 RepID=UPI00224C92EA|nr:Gfo/Idh/MocA family oxidoreductase [Streptomyces sp. NBC_01239]MCX4816284.1 Gfo/Idh/MocA family oxidoreductase [Streptomyces sp. NBC_01239]